MPIEDYQEGTVSGRWDNRYTQYFASDNALCLPVLSPEELNAILSRTNDIVEAIEGTGPKPALSLDLEHLQTADYASFPLVTREQQAAIRRLHAAEPIRTDELAYLALRSLFSFHWRRKPQSEADVRRAATWEKALETTLTEISGLVARKLERADAPLPYWGRLGFLRVMARIPDDQIEAQRLERFACVLVKHPAFNARSYRDEDSGLTGLNFALEPILKSLNRMLLHYFHTEDIAGPRRLERAWASLASVTAYFWARSAVAANRLSPFHPLFDESMAQSAHALTASQVDFIIRHELAHLVLDHGRQLRAHLGSGDLHAALRHEFEFEADIFAQGNLRSALYNDLRRSLELETAVDATTQPKPAETAADALNAMREHQAEVCGVRLLFSYMTAIDEAGRLLKERLGEAIGFRHRMDSHPSPRERLRRLDVFHLGEHPPTGKVLRYAERFFGDILSYAAQLDDAALAAPLQGLYY